MKCLSLALVSFVACLLSGCKDDYLGFDAKAPAGHALNATLDDVSRDLKRMELDAEELAELAPGETRYNWPTNLPSVGEFRIYPTTCGVDKDTLLVDELVFSFEADGPVSPRRARRAYRSLRRQAGEQFLAEPVETRQNGLRIATWELADTNVSRTAVYVLRELRDGLIYEMYYKDAKGRRCP